MKKNKARSARPDDSDAPALDLDVLWRNAEWSARVLSGLVGDGMGAALRGLGFVTAADLKEIDRTLARLEERMRKLETRRRSTRAKRQAIPAADHRTSARFE